MLMGEVPFSSVYFSNCSHGIYFPFSFVCRCSDFWPVSFFGACFLPTCSLYHSYSLYMFNDLQGACSWLSFLIE